MRRRCRLVLPSVIRKHGECRQDDTSAHQKAQNKDEPPSRAAHQYRFTVEAG